MTTPIRICALAIAAFTVAACGQDDTGETGETPVELETLPDADVPADAPTDAHNGDADLTCLGKDRKGKANAGVTLTGYARSLADPDADGDAPEGQVTAVDTDGNEFSGPIDVSKDGRVAVYVATGDEGFGGHAVVTSAGFLDWRFQSTNKVINSDYNGWAFLVTEQERDDAATGAGITLDLNKGVLVGSVHDCVAFGISNAIVEVNGEFANTAYITGFGIDSAKTFTGSSGRFAVPNLSGTVEVRAWARLESGGDFTLIAEDEISIDVAAINALSLDP